MLPQTNTRLLFVADAGSSDDYDYTGGPDDSNIVWRGSVDAYFGEEKRLLTEGSDLNRVSADTLLVDEIDVPISEGQYVVFGNRNTDGEVRTVKTVVERPALPGMPRTYKLYLNDLDRG